MGEKKKKKKREFNYFVDVCECVRFAQLDAIALYHFRCVYFASGCTQFFFNAIDSTELSTRALEHDTISVHAKTGMNSINIIETNEK